MKPSLYALSTFFGFSLIFLSAVAPQTARADDSMETFVEVEEEPDLSASYLERRTRHGFTFAISSEKFYPNDYQSMQDGKFIDVFMGKSPASLIHVELGYKMNFELGSVGLTGGIATGELKNQYAGLTRKISFQKRELLAYYYADALFQNPWVVPYIAGGMHQLVVTEQMQNEEDMQSTPTAMSMRVGLGIQLNAIDKRSAEDAYVEMGLENTFLDIYLARNTASSHTSEDLNTTEGDPDTSSTFEMGVGLRLEF